MWKDLSMAEKAHIIALGVQSGITDLSSIRNRFDYNQWKERIKQHKGIDIDNDPSYDYEEFYRSNPNRAWDMMNKDSEAHFIDEFKTSQHPSFSNQSIYSGYKNKYNPKGITGGTWINNTNYQLSQSQFDNNWDTDETIDYFEKNEREHVNLYAPDGSIVLRGITVTPKPRKFDGGGYTKGVNYYNPITGQNYGDTMPEGMSRVRRFEDLTPQAQDEYMASRPTQLDELVVTPTMTAKDIASGIFSKENWDAHKEEAIEIASFLPIIGDGIDVYDIGKDVKDGNYLEATLGTGLLVLPNIIEKPLKKGYRFVKSLFKNKNINKDATERLLKAVQNYKGSTGRAGYGVSNLRKKLKKEGIDVSRFSTEDLSILQRAREMELQKSIPNGSRVSFVRPYKKDGYSVELLDSKGSLGTLDLEDVTTDPGLDINFIKSIRKDEHKIGEDLYNSGIEFSNSIGRKGIVSGTHLLSPNKTISTMKHFPNKVLINNKGEYDFLGKTTYNNPIYRLESPGERPVVPTRDMTVFSSDIIDDNGNFIIDWSSPRLDYKNGGKLNRRQR